MTTPPEPEALGLAEAWEVLRRRRTLVLILAAGLLTLGVLLLTKVPQRYQAQAAVAFEKPAVAVEFKADPDRYFNDREQWINTRREAMLARTILAEVVASSSLRGNPVYAESRDPVETLAKRLRATTIKNTLQVVLELEDEDPVRAEEALQHLIDTFLGDQIRRTQARDAEALAFLERQLVEARRRLQTALDEERLFRDEHQLAQSTVDRHPLVRLQESLAERRAALTERRAAAGILVEQLRQAEALPDPQGRREAYLRIDRISEFTVIGNLVIELNTLQSREAGLAVKYGDRHPRLIQARQELQAKRDQLDRAIDASRAGIEAEYRQVDEQLAALARSDDEVRSELARLRDAQSRLEALHAVTEAQSRAIAAMEEAITQRRISSQMEQTRLQVVDPPRAGAEPVGLRRGPLTGAIVVLALLGAAALTLAIELASGHLRSSREAARRAGVPDLGTVFLGRRRHLPDGGDAPQVEESIRGLRTRLRSDGATTGRVLVVVSWRPGEGRSTLALRLAASHAAAGAPSLLVEGDLHGDSLAGDLPVPPGPGVSDLLAGTPDVAPVETAVPNLAFLPRGSSVANPGDLLAGPTLGEWLQHCRAYLEAVVIDTPALAESADALAWAVHADAVILAVGPTTTRDDLDRCLVALAPCRNRIAGVVQMADHG